MIERLLTAEAALADDDLDQAGRLYEQIAAADPRNAIAIVGLARVARRRGDPAAARGLATQALAVDPDEDAARRLLAELDEPAVRLEASPAGRPESVADPEVVADAELSSADRPPERASLGTRLRARLARLLRRG